MNTQAANYLLSGQVPQPTHSLTIPFDEAQSNMGQSPIFSNFTSIFLGWLVSCLRSPSAADKAGGAAWSFSEPIHPTPPPPLHHSPCYYTSLSLRYQSLEHYPPLSSIPPQCSIIISSTHFYYKAPSLISVSHLHLCLTISVF